MSWGDPAAFGFLLLLGGLSGFVSGMLGVGGGIVVVPALIFVLPLFGISGPEMPKIAMATSLALVIPTAIASAQAHAAKGAIDWWMAALLAPGIVFGAFVAATFAAGIDTQLLMLVYAAFALFTAWKLVRRRSRAEHKTSATPHPIAFATKSFLGGGLASLLGLGVAFFAVPMLSRFLSVPRAIGTASALALPTAIAGTSGYLMAHAPASCADCAGYVFVPAVAGVGISAVLAASMGAWAAHAMPVTALRRVFALFLVFAAANLAYKSFTPASAARLAAETQRIIAIGERLIHPDAWRPQAAEAPGWLLQAGIPSSVSAATNQRGDKQPELVR